MIESGEARWELIVSLLDLSLPSFTFPPGFEREVTWFRDRWTEGGVGRPGRLRGLRELQGWSSAQARRSGLFGGSRGPPLPPGESVNRCHESKVSAHLSSRRLGWSPGRDLGHSDLRLREFTEKTGESRPEPGVWGEPSREVLNEKMPARIKEPGESLPSRNLIQATQAILNRAVVRILKSKKKEVKIDNVLLNPVVYPQYYPKD